MHHVNVNHKEIKITSEIIKEWQEKAQNVKNRYGNLVSKEQTNSADNQANQADKGNFNISKIVEQSFQI